ncbi:hypothetical protein [Carnobacterium sp. TMP28]|uniref:hypothetical protein n=1 Tax=Carnobacterium sp. TMP28 TaxID=3397060 RepID=UPI0039E15DFF
MSYLFWIGTNLNKFWLDSTKRIEEMDEATHNYALKRTLKLIFRYEKARMIYIHFMHTHQIVNTVVQKSLSHTSLIRTIN